MLGQEGGEQQMGQNVADGKPQYALNVTRSAAVLDFSRLQQPCKRH